MAFFDIAMTANTLSSRHVDELRKLTSKKEFSSDDFLHVANCLSASPESFVGELREKLGVREIGEEDLLPQDVRHWEHLVPSNADSTSLADYLVNELDAEWRRRLNRDARHAFPSIALTFASQAVVPRSLLRNLSPDELKKMLEVALLADDHFAHVGAFEICCEWVKHDRSFVPLGDRILDRLFRDTHHLLTACGMFAVGFIIATAHLTRHEFLSRRPVYWRRLAAAAHASLVVRACGASKNDYDKLIAWAMRVSGQVYMCSVLSDMVDEPRWRPEWISPEYLMSDAYGRARNAAQQLGNRIPQTWKRRLETIEKWLLRKGTWVFASFPSLLEGGLAVQRPSLSNLESVADHYKRFKSKPTARNFIRIVPLFQSFGTPLELEGSVERFFERLRSKFTTLSDEKTSNIISMISHLAVQTKNTTLARDVSELCVQELQSNSHPGVVREGVTRIVECSASEPDREAACRVLVRQLESLAFSIPLGEGLVEFSSALETLKQANPILAPLLGRALAVARLGVSKLN